MKLYNSLTNSLETFKPMEEGKVSIYVCGPTVYNYPHVGNARPIVVFDTLVKTLEKTGLDVTYASNFTDVDDKIINTAIEENTTEKEITDRYIEAYKQTRKDLNAREPDTAPRVTETMDKIISFIEELVEKGAAYEVDGDVYYRVDSDPKYGELSKQRPEDLKVGARIDENDKKENPLDFTLWKTTDKGIQWDSPWGKGRPGWHTECVVMIQDVFKKPLIDIHGGGMDLKFPHHENEIAQCRSLHDTSLANYWIHNGMINIDGEKMSKSLGNVRWAKDLIEKVGGPVVRWALIGTHYRAPLDLSEKTLDDAAKEIEKIRKPMQQAVLMLALNGAAIKEDEKAAEYWNEFMTAMEEDLNTPNAISALQKTVKALNAALRQKEMDTALVGGLAAAINNMLYVLGVQVELIEPEAQDLEDWRSWKACVKEKDFENADKYRAKLMEKGLI
ncbi:MAG: cysteine--tRNA ligase [Ileibacterium sp.]|nr:cysteine--tRNA ligase [Ileibacterium sp.]